MAYVAQSFYGQLKKEEKKTAQRRERDRGREGEGEQTSTPEGGSIVHRAFFTFGEDDSDFQSRLRNLIQNNDQQLVEHSLLLYT